MPEQLETHCRSTLDLVGTLANRLRSEFGFSFSVYDAVSGKPLLNNDSAAEQSAESEVPASVVREWGADSQVRVIPLPLNRYQLVLPIHSGQGAGFVAVGTTEALVGNPEVFPARAAREQAMWQGWLQAVGEQFRLSEPALQRHRGERAHATGSSLSWEALLAVDQVTRGLRLHRAPRKNQQRILAAVSRLVAAEASLWAPTDAEQDLLWEGEIPFAPDDCRQLITRFMDTPDFRSAAPILCNDVQTTGWGRDFPLVRTLMAFQVGDKRPLGWFIALNKKDDTPFRRSDAALVLPFVALMEMNLRWTCRHQDLKDLLVGLTRSLTTAIDAKDAYTYGHSERVARTAVELGRELGLGPDELGDIYLAGLLHDVGKIGVRDTVLRKPAALTPEEQEHIQQHVLIGYSILADLRQIRSLLPGVLYHHERYDGKGYPDGLAGDEIPLLARILAVADAYDAMSHPRPYRDSMPYRKVEQILAQGAGVQWDQKVIDAFFRCRQRIHAIRQRGVGDSLRHAIDGALRDDANSRRPSSGSPKTLRELVEPNPELL
jgi:HD-GYP domain-containing protein (c-di-GMP phosphodiesterase class II)